MGWNFDWHRTGKDEAERIVTMRKGKEQGIWKIASITGGRLSKIGDIFTRLRLSAVNAYLREEAALAVKRFPHCRTVTFTILHGGYRQIRIKNKRLHFRNSKWTQYLLLKERTRLLPYLPETDYCTRKQAASFLQAYREIILKPCVGQEGRGIIELIKRGAEHYEVRCWDEEHFCFSFDEAYDLIADRYMAGKPYIVQRKLRLAEVDGSPFDLRILMHKTPSGWVQAGSIAKVAADRFFVTNVAKRLLSFEEALAQSTVSHLSVTSLKDRIGRLCITASRQLEKELPEPDLIGFDIAVTQCGSVFILEGNFMPDISMFRSLPDRDIYEKILRRRTRLAKEGR